MISSNTTNPIGSSSLGNIALVFDMPSPLVPFEHCRFPHDACAEWESQDTVSKLEESWRALGFNVVSLPLDRFFFSRWSEVRGSLDLVHTVVEGWGSLAREGWIPSLCELSGIPYIGSGPAAQAMAMKKSLVKLVCQSLLVPTAPWHLITNLSDLKNIPADFFKRKHFIKPDAEGSGMGVDIAHSISQSFSNTQETVKQLLTHYTDGVLLEEYLPGAEFTSAQIGTPGVFLPIAQIEVDTGVYGLANKGKDAMNERVTFPKLPNSIHTQIEAATRKLCHYFGFLDFVRMDWKIDSRGQVQFLEANPLAGLSYYYSVLPKMAAQAGLSYESLLKRLAESALSRKQARNFWYGHARLK